MNDSIPAQLKAAGVEYPANWDEMGGSEKDLWEDRQLARIARRAQRASGAVPVKIDVAAACLLELDANAHLYPASVKDYLHERMVKRIAKHHPAADRKYLGNEEMLRALALDALHFLTR